MNAADFTRVAAGMVRRNDRLTFRGVLVRAARRVGVLWCALAASGVVVYMVPPYARVYG